MCENDCTFPLNNHLLVRNFLSDYQTRLHRYTKRTVLPKNLARYRSENDFVGLLK